ncbi:ATP-binding protein [Actinoplanes sp. M2I2]|uniref:ATP-binding protein n=1 Tax=Actinoplanes sp. M2I2 TaxID=1734444 RepID=UPI0020216988|nr:ATP-binding protein [Actinoplanes sp. M2I2]
MNPLRLSAPPAHARQLRIWELTGDAELRVIRTDLHRHFDADRPDERENAELAQRIALVATELAGNALRHGTPPVVVRLLGDEDCYVLDVSDHDPHHAPQLPGPRRQINAGGRGLHIAGSLAQQLCWYKDADTKHVWASFPRPHRALDTTAVR